MNDFTTTEGCTMLDLSKFNLTLPVGAKIIPTAQLNAGYTSEFFVRNDDGSVTFTAPSSGSGIRSTANSTYPRSELRETLANGDDNEANWKVSSAPVHILEATLSVDELPASGKAIIGQFHGESDHPPMKIQITGSTIYAQLRKKLDGTEDKITLLTGYKLRTVFSYKVELFADGRCKFYIDGKQIINDKLPESGYQFDLASYKNDTWYAKAGIYSQEKVGGQGRGQATFRALRMYHGPVEQAAATPAAPVTPAARVIGDLSREVAQALGSFQAGTSTANQALEAIQALKTEADTKFSKGNERSALYEQVNSARAAIRTPATTPQAPVTPAEPVPTASGGDAIKEALSAMEDVLDDLPDASATKLRKLIGDVRGMVA